MPTFTATAGAVAGILSLAAYLRYIIAILSKQTRPNRATWWTWTAVGLMLASSYFASGARDSMFVPLTYVIGPLLTAVLSVWYGEGGWTSFDRKCLLGAVGGLVLWLATGSPVTALVLNLLVDAMGCLPTIKKAYRDSRSEDPVAWMLWFGGNFVNMFAVENWTPELAMYPIYMFVGTGVIASVVIIRNFSQGSFK